MALNKSTPFLEPSTIGMKQEEWLAARRTGIGGSDAAKILGISKWGGALSVWMEKTGRCQQDEMSEAAEMGLELEETVARVFTKRTGIKVERRNKIFRHKEYPWMLANIDRKIVGENKGLECKTTHYRKGDLWIGDELPDEYYAQVQHYISVMGWDSCYIAALIGGQKFVWKEVQRDNEFIAIMIEKEREFWELFIEKDVMPPASEYDDMTEIYPENSDEDFVPATNDHISLATELEYVKSEQKRLKEQQAYLENVFKQCIGEHSGMDGIATWRNSKPSIEVNWEAVAIELMAPDSLVKKHTTIKAGSRRFLFKFKTEKQSMEVA